MSASLAILGRFRAFELVKEGELPASYVLHLFTEAASVVELARRRNIVVLVLRHCLGQPEKLPSTNFSISPTLSATVVGTSPTNERFGLVAPVPESGLLCAAHIDTQTSNAKTIPAFIPSS